jgi:hypothetical protein
MKKGYVLLVLALLLAGMGFAHRLASLPDLLNPETIRIYGDQMFITDFPRVKIYSTTDFTLQEEFGEQGEGPRQFMGSLPGICVLGDHIIVNSQQKISYYTKGGEFVKEMKVKAGSNFKPIGDKFVAYGFREEQKVLYQTVNLCDANLEKIKEIFRQKSWNQMTQAGYMDVLNIKGYICRVDGDRMVIDGEGGTLYVFDGEGNRLRSISPQYEKIKVTAEDKKRYHHYYKTDPHSAPYYDFMKTRFRFRTYFPEIRFFDVADGKIYIMTYKQRGKDSEFLIYDIDGTFLKRVTLPIAFINAEDIYPFTVKDDKIYQLIDNPETEEWELHRLAVE